MEHKVRGRALRDAAGGDRPKEALVSLWRVWWSFILR